MASDTHATSSATATYTRHVASLAILKPLTSLRFFAALAVFLSHLGYVRNVDSFKWLSSRIFVEGYAGVTFFFVLSGFILTYNYRHVLSDLRLREIKSFYVARFARIYPLYLLTFLISLPLLRHQIIQQPANFLYTAIVEIFALQSYVPLESDFAYNMPAWSLCDEFFFYALLPFILYVFARIKVTSAKSLLALGLLLWASASVLVWLGRDIASAHWLFYITPPFRLFDFALGVVCGLCFLQTQGAHAPSRVSDRAPAVGNNARHCASFPSSALARSEAVDSASTACEARALPAQVWTALELACLGGILAQVLFSTHVHQSFRYGVYYMPIFCLTIFVFAHQSGSVSAMLSGKTLVLLGEMSFAFYMFHQLVFRYLHEISHGKIGYVYFPIASTILAFAITLGLSYVSFVYYEKFTRNKLKKALQS